MSPPPQWLIDPPVLSVCACPGHVRWCVNSSVSVLNLQIITAAPQKFSIEILPVDDGTPRIVTNLGLQWLEYMDDKVQVSSFIFLCRCHVSGVYWNIVCMCKMK